MVAWTDLARLQRALGPSVTLDASAQDCVDAANAWAARKRREAGYDDDQTDLAPAPGPDVAFGTTLYAIALWRERASTEGYASFDDLAAYVPTGGSAGQIRRLLGIGRAVVDAPPAAVSATARRWRWGP